MKTQVRVTLACLASIFVMGTVSAQQQQPPAPPPEASQFDFWIGEWEVTQPNGKVAGYNSIVSVNGGRALLENWTSAAGNFAGKSLNSYDAVAKKWKQFWVDTGGSVLELSGGIVDGKMVLAGRSITAAGGEMQQRITWTPNEDGSVRQHWEQSSDGGTTWQTAFDGHYVKKATPAQS
ncbi:MAG TPA: hypothetical protein VIK52_00835 [Opitutaceae bacterium]